MFANDGPLRKPAPCTLSAHWPHMAVLVVEDHSTYRALMGWFLQKLGIDYELAGNGQCALSAMARRNFDLVISDCQMPLMDGYTLARSIRFRERIGGRKRVPIIALTADLLPSDAQRCRDAGMDAWLLKPLGLEQLGEVLARWLPGSQPESSIRQTAPPSLTWPTRASLIETFGSSQVVNQMLGTLVVEACEDSAALAHARMTLNASLTAERLHRLVGSLVFLGGADLEARGRLLIDQVRAHGVVLNKQRLADFQRDLEAYLGYLNAL